MPANVNTLLLDIVSRMKGDGFKKTEANIKRLQKVTKNLTNVEFNHMLQSMEKNKKVAKRWTKDLTMGLKNARKEAKTFKFQWLGIMFAGMALQRFTMKAVKGLFEVFNKANEGANELNQKTNKVTGAFEYFKYSIAQALAESPAFQGLVNWLTNIIDKLSSMPQWIKSSLGLMLLILVPIAGALMVIGQVMLGINSIKLLNISHGLLRILYGAEGAKNATLGLTGALKLLAGTAIITGIIAILYFLAKLHNRIGGMWELTKAVMRGVERTYFVVFSKIADGVMWLYNNAIRPFINLIITGVDKLLSLFGGGISFRLPEVGGGESWGDKLMSKFLEKQGESWLAPKEGYLGDAGQAWNEIMSSTQTTQQNITDMNATLGEGGGVVDSMSNVANLTNDVANDAENANVSFSGLQTTIDEISGSEVYIDVYERHHIIGAGQSIFQEENI